MLYLFLGITILGCPAEVFIYGGMVSLNVLGIALAALLATFVFIPLFYPLQLTSINMVNHSHSQVSEE